LCRAAARAGNASCQSIGSLKPRRRATRWHSKTYSSGSTGRPKGIVELQHDMVYTAASYAAHVLRLRPDDICFSVPKIFFAYGFGNATDVCGRRLESCFPDDRNRRRCSASSGNSGRRCCSRCLVKAPQAPAIYRACVCAYQLPKCWPSSAPQRGRSCHRRRPRFYRDAAHVSNTEAATRPGASGLRVPGYEVKLLDAEGRQPENKASCGCGAIRVPRPAGTGRTRPETMR
jgi:hypothetical protein